MNALLLPATRLMEQLRLLPKFLLVSLVFILPLGLVTGLLFNELQKSIAFAELEQDGLRYAVKAEDIHVLLQRHQALRYMELGGNAKMQAPAKLLQTSISNKLTEFERDGATVSRIGLHDALADIQKKWTAMQQQTDVKAKDDYAAHAALIAQVQKFRTGIADRTNLRLDPETSTHYLALTLLDNIPAVTENLLTIGGRGAAYIDTGLLEANEEVMLASTVTSGKIELTQLSEKLNALFYDTPEWKAQLSRQVASLPVAAAFFERATNEVMKSLDQTSGEQFIGAAEQATQQLQTLSGAATTLLNDQLAQRVGHYQERRNLIMAAVLAVLALAGYLLAGFYNSFREEIGFLSSAVESTAAGDLRLQSVSHGKDEISALVGAFSNMNVSLAQLISNVRRSAKVITAASREIAIGNNDLSQRTESQASSLQETASSMEVLTATVKKNAANAEHANALALSASNFAVKGGQAVGDVVETMASIKQSSDKISGIISVIDGIAFQTNILALNAAVEAARAGEQGRGFAVVASEVRVLAQRSAAAAKEIKGLIDDSVGKVEAGGRQVQGAGQTMNDIVNSINEVVGIMSEITTSSQEQSAGIAEVGGAMAHIDSMTQRNAALVEEAAAAAESLQQHAGLLASAVSVFKLEEETENADAHAEHVIAAPTATVQRLEDFAHKPVRKAPASPAVAVQRRIA
ncbi:methyl-accepting chemotaxis protein [Herbaspirillum rhizosphaerae]|uniref:methyl-accepting chemotaxis protein n=1 Tax=Herbaspirillum rhizosphaerae TaxID=346179 RepID=UPI0023E373BD|nr:methyl-accepting chemotaxis protein [Herbaspirillum rhizosphaerae]